MAARIGEVEFDVRGCDGELAAIGHGIAGVDGEVHEHLLDLAGVSFDLAEGRIEGEVELDVLADQARQHLFHVGDEGVEIEDDGFENLLTAESQKLTREGDRAMVGILDFLGVLEGLVRGTELAFKYWAITEYNTK